MRIEILEEGDCGDCSYFLFETKFFAIGFERFGFMDNVRKFSKSIHIRLGQNLFSKDWDYETPPMTKEEEEELNKAISEMFKRVFKKEH